MLKLSTIALACLPLALVSCGAAKETPPAEPAVQAARSDASSDASAVREGSDTFSGDIVLMEYQPFGVTQIVRINLATGQKQTVADGVEFGTSGDQIVFLTTCGEFSANYQLTVQDADGFTTNVGPCGEGRINLTTIEFGRPALSPDQSYVAVYDGDIFIEGNPASGFSDLGRTAKGIRIYDRDGDEVAVPLGFASPAWGPDGALYAAGTGTEEGVPHGVYRFAPDFKAFEKVDDGRLNNQVHGLRIHPDGREGAFIYNNQLWKIELRTGEPRRVLAYEHAIGDIAYSPDGAAIAFLVDEPTHLSAQIGGYAVFLFDGDKVSEFAIEFIPEGPLSWVATP